VHEAIAGHLRRIGQDKISNELQERCQNLFDYSKDLFSPILLRQQQANANRNALTIVAAQRFLFNLPERYP
jgi:hypothetical protein